MQEQYQQRNQPLNEITALMAGSQVQQPNWLNAPTSQIPTTDIGGLINQNFAQQQQNYQTARRHGMRRWAACWGSAARGRAGIMASDREVKKNIDRRWAPCSPRRPDGERKELPIYEWIQLQGRSDSSAARRPDGAGRRKDRPGRRQEDRRRQAYRYAQGHGQHSEGSVMALGFFTPSGDPNVDMEMRRKIALAIMARGRKAMPKNLGEGIASIGQEIGDYLAERSILAENAAANKANDEFAGKYTGTAPQAAVAPATYAPPENVPPPLLPLMQLRRKARRLSQHHRHGRAPLSRRLHHQAAPRPSPVSGQLATWLRRATSTKSTPPTRVTATVPRRPNWHRRWSATLPTRSAAAISASSPARKRERRECRRPGRRGRSSSPAAPAHNTAFPAMQVDPDASTRAVNAFTNDNVAALTAKLGREPTPGEMALAHQQGAGTAGNMLTGQGNASASNLAVNNVPAGAGPQAAASKIMGYYGMPGAAGVPANPRDAVAAAVTAQQDGGRPSVGDSRPEAGTSGDATAGDPGRTAGAATSPGGTVTATDGTSKSACSAAAATGKSNPAADHDATATTNRTGSSAAAAGDTCRRQGSS